MINIEEEKFYLYCPACGMPSLVKALIVVLSPDGIIDVTCPECKTEFNITLHFEEVAK